MAELMLIGLIISVVFALIVTIAIFRFAKRKESNYAILYSVIAFLIATVLIFKLCFVVFIFYVEHTYNSAQ